MINNMVFGIGFVTLVMIFLGSFVSAIALKMYEHASDQTNWIVSRLVTYAITIVLGLCVAAMVVFNLVYVVSTLYTIFTM